MYLSPFRSLAVVFLLGRPSLAAQTEKVQARCPADGRSFEVERLIVTDNLGGVDRDFFERGSAPEDTELAIIACPACGFSAPAGGFERPLPPEAVEKLKAPGALSPPAPIAPGAAQRGIPGWVKADLAGQSAAIEGASAWRRARLAMQAAWSVRLNGGVDPRGASAGPLAALVKRFPAPEAAEGRDLAEEEIAFANALLRDAEGLGSEKTLALFRAASLLRRRGENPAALRALDRLENEGAGDDLLQAAGATRETIERERGYQRRALALLEEARDRGEVPEGEKAGLDYLLGEIRRRLGENEAARAHFDRALKDPALPGRLRKWLEEQRAKAEEPKDAEKADGLGGRGEAGG